MLRLAAVGIPLGGTVLVKFSVLGVLTFAAARISTDAAAVHGVSESLVNVIFTAAVAVGQSTVPLIADYASRQDLRRIRRSVGAGARVALSAVTVLGAALLALRVPVVGLFTTDPSLGHQVRELLPLVLAVVVADALQAVAGFALVGLRRTGPSLVSTVLWFGVLAVLAVPVADTYGLTGLWAALACANLLQAGTKTYSFLRHSRMDGGGGRVPRSPYGWRQRVRRTHHGRTARLRGWPRRDSHAAEPPAMPALPRTPPPVEGHQHDRSEAAGPMALVLRRVPTGVGAHR